MKPGIYEMPEDEYHADPVPGGSLSSTGARKILPPGCPARFHYDRHNPPTTSKAFSMGRAAHQIVLGVDPGIFVGDYPNWRTKAAQEAKAAAEAAGLVALLPDDMAQIEAMADQIRAHTVATKLLSNGKPEQTLIWQDEETGVWCRARLDFLPDTPPPGRRLILPDYKTSKSAEPEYMRKHIYDYGYYIQAAWYRRGAKALRIDEDALFVFIVQEKEPPYIVTLFVPDYTMLAYGEAQCQRALKKYAECEAKGVWGPYSDEIVYVSLPAWVESDIQRRGSW
jgi:hypothetical protein